MEDNKTGHYIYDFERGEFWKKNEMGYTSILKEAGRYDLEDAHRILKSANIKDITAEVIHCTDVDRLLHLESKVEVGSKKKPDLQDIISEYIKPNQYFETNPLNDIINDLEKSGYYFDNVGDRVLSYNEKARIYLQSEEEKKGILVNLQRLGTGRYEVVINITYPEQANNIDKPHDGKKTKNKIKQ
jgi:hypothetical protein